jgi:hypothetical protein
LIPQGGSVGPPLTAATDAVGRYQLLNVPAGAYYALAEAAGFARQAYGQRAGTAGRLIAVQSNQTTDAVDFHLLRFGVIEGRVSGDTGQPLEGASVALCQYLSYRDIHALASKLTASTDRAGYFRIADVPPGRYYVAATYRAPNNTKGLTYAPTYYPSTDDATLAVSVTVDPGAQMNRVELRMALTPAFMVRGTVGGPDGVPLGNAPVVARKYPLNEIAISMGVDPVRTKPDGSFELSGVPPGRYQVTARFDGAANYSRRGVAWVEVQKRNVSDVRIAVGSGAVISGRVLLDASGTVDYRRVTVSVLPEEPSGATAVTVTAQPDGRFRFDAIPEGDVRITARSSDPKLYLKSVRLGGGDITSRSVRMSNGTNWADAEVAFSAQAAQFRGVVRGGSDGSPVPGAAVVLFPVDRALRFAYTHEDGAAIFGGISPGRYLVGTVVSPDPSLLADPAYLAELERAARTIEFRPGEVRSEILTVR